MEKINIAELLKDCPKGMELYSPIFGKVYLEKIRPYLAIIVTTDKGQGDFKEEFLYDGRYGMNGECMLFPSKGKTTWEGFEKSFKENKNLEKNKFPSFEPMFKMNDELEYKIPDGYEITEVSKDKVFIKPIKPKYPKTYEECCKVLDFCGDCFLTTYQPESMIKKEVYGILQQVNSLTQLLICKSAYWKIAGEEMGLGKPWDPTYGCGEWGYWFGYSINENKIYLQDSRILVNHTLVFPTKEMRNIFYENFKDLIEQCKELL